MKVFLTGATGYIGSAVCELLKSKGHQPMGLARSAEKAQFLESRGYLARPGDLRDPASLRAPAAEADAVIHLARDPGPDSGQVDRAAVEAMLDALSGPTKPFIYTSGVWVIGDTDGRMVGEVAALHPPELVAWRPAVEELVLEAKERQIRSMVFRPGMVFGRGGGALGGFFRQAREQGAVRIIGKGDNHWSSIHVEDLAALYQLALEQPYSGELFLACGGMPQPVKKIALAVASACGIPDKVESISLEEARAQMGPVADCLVLDNKAGSTKAARFFGWTVRKPSIFDEIASAAS